MILPPEEELGHLLPVQNWFPDLGYYYLLE